MLSAGTIKRPTYFIVPVSFCFFDQKFDIVPTIYSMFSISRTSPFPKMPNEFVHCYLRVKMII